MIVREEDRLDFTEITESELRFGTTDDIVRRPGVSNFINSEGEYIDAKRDKDTCNHSCITSIPITSVPGNAVASTAENPETVQPDSPAPSLTSIFIPN